MKLTLGQIKDIYPSFLNLRKETKLKLATRWSIKQLVRPFDNYFREIEEHRLELVNELGVNGSDNIKRVTSENLPKFAEEMEALYKKEVDLPDLAIELNELEKAEFLSSNDLDGLEVFIVEPTKNKE